MRLLKRPVLALGPLLTKLAVAPASAQSPTVWRSVASRSPRTRAEYRTRVRRAVARWVPWPFVFGCIACGGPGPIAPTAPTTRADAVPTTPLFPVCGVLPNYLDQEGAMFRWERFPLRVSIVGVSLSMAGDRAPIYDQGIRHGVIVWFLATQGIVGNVIVELDLNNPDVVIRLSAADEEERVFGIEGRFTWKLVDHRRLGHGTIEIYPEVAQEIVRARHIPESSDYVANIVAHEMGHALGVQKHSNDRSDLMHSGRNHGAVPYPWVTQRDLNTMQEAYCR